MNDIEIAYKIYGNENNYNNTILLITGSGQTKNSWEPVFIEKLVASNNNVIVFDNRGIGDTTKGMNSFSVKQFANDTIMLLETLGINKKIDILGFSLGSLVAQEIAINHPEKIRKLILYGSTDSVGKNAAAVQDKKIMNIFYSLRNKEIFKNMSPEEINTNISLLYFPENWIKNNSESLKHFPVTDEPFNYEIFKLQGEAYMNWDGSYNIIDTIRIPTLIIVGTDDIVTLPMNSVRLAQKIPGAWLIQVKNAGHGLMYQYPLKFSNIIQLFLE